MKDPALSLSNPRLLSAAYFGLLSIVATFLIEGYLTLFGVVKFLPMFKSMLLAFTLAAVFGALFGKKILYCERDKIKYAFFWGAVMTLCAIPFHAVGLLYFLQSYHPAMLGTSTNFMHYVDLYFFTLAYSFILAGFWLSLAAGFAAILLRKYLVYSIIEDREVKSIKTVKKARVKVKKHNKPLTH